MRPLAKILTAGTCLATASLFAAATSAQSYGEVWAPVDNRQVQTAPVTADSTLEAVDPDSFVVESVADGNSFGTGAVGVSLDVRSDQQLDGDVTATSTINVIGTSYAGSVHTAAHGNAGSAIVEGANLRGRVGQTVGAGRTITADAHLDQGPTGALGDVGLSTTAVANNMDYGVTGGWSETDTTQSSGASVWAETGADVQMVTGSLAVASTAAGNNLNSAVDQGSGYTRADQSQSGEYVYAGTYVASGWGQQVVGAASAAGNNLTAFNAYGPMEASVRQDNASYVRSQSEVAVYEYGSATAVASGVGNAIHATNLGADTAFDAEQVARGGVDVYASFTGGYGYDSTAQATAHGNSIAVSNCSTCVSTFEASGHQVNHDGVVARAHTNVTGDARHATTSAGAVGNSASYYIQRPGY